jgi:hypothetical protein
MRFFLSIFVSLLVVVSACGKKESKGVNSTSSEQEIYSILENYYETMSDRNWKLYADFFSNKATLTTLWEAPADSFPKVTTYTIDDFLSQTKDGPDSQPIFEERMLHAEISARQNLASAWVEYEAKFGSEDSLIEWKGYDLFSMIKFENKWKIVSIVYESEN